MHPYVMKIVAIMPAQARHNADPAIVHPPIYYYPFEGRAFILSNGGALFRVLERMYDVILRPIQTIGTLRGKI